MVEHVGVFVKNNKVIYGQVKFVHKILKVSLSKGSFVNFSSYFLLYFMANFTFLLTSNAN
jgi:hypothetical protein